MGHESTEPRPRSISRETVSLFIGRSKRRQLARQLFDGRRRKSNGRGPSTGIDADVFSVPLRRALRPVSSTVHYHYLIAVYCCSRLFVCFFFSFSNRLARSRCARSRLTSRRPFCRAERQSRPPPAETVLPSDGRALRSAHRSPLTRKETNRNGENVARPPVARTIRHR